MNLLPRPLSLVWFLVLVATIALICTGAARHLHRVEQISNLAGGDTLVVDRTSPTGYAGGGRKLVLPELNHRSHQWIAQTQQMLAKQEWRVRHIDSDNAPTGREIFTPSPYRWWLGSVAWADHTVTGRPLALAVERTAVLAGPALQLLLVLGAAAFAARYFGAHTAGIVAVALAVGFPLAGNFLTPLPGDAALALACAVWSLLPLLAALLSQRRRTANGSRGLFILAGVAGGAALWTDVATAVPLLGGIALGGALTVLTARRQGAQNVPAAALPAWRCWACSGAAMSLAAYFIEYAPAHLGGLRLNFNHPLYALAWVGVGELLHRFTTAQIGVASAKSRGARFAWIGAALAVVALPVGLLLADGPGFLASADQAGRLSLLPGSSEAPHVLEWIAREGFSLSVVATLLPLLVLIPAVRQFLRRRDEPGTRVALALLAGPALLALGFAFCQPRAWALVDVVLLGVLVAVTLSAPARTRFGGFFWFVATAFVLLPGALAVWPKVVPNEPVVSEVEFEALVQRDLAQWLAARTPDGGATVLAPPALTSALNFFGGVRGLATPDPANQDGFGAAVRIAAAASTDEAEALIRKREVTHVVLPSWDKFMDEFARLGSNQPQKTLVALLNQWLPPRWLRPVPYALPQVEGIGDRHVVVFEVTEVQDNVTALARLADYFIEMGQPEAAVAVAQALEQKFTAEPGALIARAQVAIAAGDRATLAALLRTLRPALDRGEDADLPWDRRVALAVVLAQGKQADLAKARTQECLASADEARLRQLSTRTLYQLQLLAKAYGLAIEDPALRAKARALLPAELQAKL